MVKKDKNKAKEWYKKVEEQGKWKKQNIIISFFQENHQLMSCIITISLLGLLIYYKTVVMVKLLFTILPFCLLSFFWDAEANIGIKRKKMLIISMLFIFFVFQSLILENMYLMALAGVFLTVWIFMN